VSKHYSAHMTVVFHRVKNIPLSQTPVITESESASISQLLLAQISHHPLAVQDPQYQLQRKHNNSIFRRMDAPFSCSFGFSVPHIGLVLFVNSPIHIKMCLISKPNSVHNNRICFSDIGKLTQKFTE
jgi:hypothetical protein